MKLEKKSKRLDPLRTFFSFCTRYYRKNWKKKAENVSFKNGHILTICGHFFGYYIGIFHKTEIQMVIL